MMIENNAQWARAIAARITDEHPIKADFPEDSALLQSVLERLFSENVWAVRELIGTGVIEESFFDSLR